jgi:hypothetical protein
MHCVFAILLMVLVCRRSSGEIGSGAFCQQRPVTVKEKGAEKRPGGGRFPGN